MSKDKKPIPVIPKPVMVGLVVNESGKAVLDEPIHIINEIIMNTNALVESKQAGLSCLLYLGSAQRYAMRFVNPQGLLDPMQGTFAGIPVIWVEAGYHVNLVAKKDAPKQG